MKQTLAFLLGVGVASSFGPVCSTVAADPVVTIGTNTYTAFNRRLPAGTRVYLDANPAAGSPLRATQRSLGYREVEYKAVVYPTLFFQPAPGVSNRTNVNYDYTAQVSKTNTVGFWAAKDLPIIIGPDGNAYITDGHHTTAGYLAPASPVRRIIPGLERVTFGHIVTNYFDEASGPTPPTDAWWSARSAENNALLIGPEGDLLAIPGESGFAIGRPIPPSVQTMPTTPSSLSGAGLVAMTPSTYRSLAWGLADGIVSSATDAAGRKIAGYSKSIPGLSADINFVEFFWADYLRDRVVWDDSRSGSPLGTGVDDANAIGAPPSFFTAVANGIALCRSEAYLDRRGRNIRSYTNSAMFAPAVIYWANASISNGLALASHTYHLYLRDDSGIRGLIAPSALSTNILHIDTASSLTVTQSWQNIRTLVINAGGSLETAWKDTTVSNSVLRLAPGTGNITLVGNLIVADDTRVAGGALKVQGRLTSPKVEVDGGILLAGHFVGALTVRQDGRLASGLFTVAGPVTLGGATVRTATQAGVDLVHSTHRITFDGALRLESPGVVWARGDTVRPFDAPAYAGYFFEGLDLPALPTGLGWDTSRLAVDGSLVVASTVGNLAPKVTLSGPTNATVSGSASFMLNARGADPEGKLAKIEIFEGDRKLGRSGVGDFTLPQKAVSPGRHTYRAIATDHLGAVSAVSEFQVTVTSTVFLR